MARPSEQAAYDLNPKLCATCGNPIPYAERRNKYCSHECAVRGRHPEVYEKLQAAEQQEGVTLTAKQLYNRDYQKSHPEKKKAYNAESYQKHKAERDAKHASYVAEHGSDIQAYQAAYHARNRDAINARKRQKYQEKRAAQLAAKKAESESTNN